MADQMLLDYLAAPVMTELLASEDIKRGVPTSLPAELYAKSDTIVDGNKVIWDAINGNRSPSTAVHPDSPSRRVETPGRIRREATAICTKENIVLDHDFLTALKAGIPVWADRARNHFVQRMKDFRSRFEVFQTALVGSAFSQGEIWIDANGNILPSSSGAMITVDFQGNYSGTNALSKTSNYPNVPTYAVGDWSSASTDIPTSIRTMLQSYLFTSNYQAATVLYGKAIPGYFYNNTAMQTYLSRQPQLNQEFMDTNEVPKGLLDLNWKPAYKEYFVGSTGTVNKWWADNQIVVIPNVTDEWYEYFEGRSLIPNTIVSPGMSIEQLVGATSLAKGYFSYAEMTTDPVAARVIAGWSGLPTQKNQNVVWSITVS